MAVDRGFAERIARIESGKQWIPDGVVMPSKKASRRRKAAVQQSKRVTFVLSLVLISGLAMVFANQQPELAGLLMAGDLQGLVDSLSGIAGI